MFLEKTTKLFAFENTVSDANTILFDRCTLFNYY